MRLTVATVVMAVVFGAGLRGAGQAAPSAVRRYVERHNLSMRMTVRRYTRLTNAFSKKIENHTAAVALGYFAYNFIKIHRTLRVTPAMAAGVTEPPLVCFPRSNQVRHFPNPE